MNLNGLFLIVLVGLLVYSNYNLQNPVQEDTNDVNNNLLSTDMIDSSLSITASDMFQSGVSLNGYVFKMISEDGSTGTGNMDGTKYQTEPGKNYKLYFFTNTTNPSRTYYAYTEDYTAPLQSSTDAIQAKGCKIDTAPLLVTYDDNSRIQSSSSNALSIGASQTKDIAIKLKAHNDQCFGTPNAPKNNIVCFAYSSTHFSSVKMNSGHLPVPNSITTQSNTSGMAIDCYNFPVLKDTGERELGVSITSTASDPGIGQNITVFVDDIALDLNAITGEEIWGFEDEQNNQLGMNSYQAGYIYIS